MIIDGNYFTYSRMSVLPKDVKDLHKEKDMEIFMRKLAIDFSSEFRKFNGIVDRIVFTQDYRSWRKDVLPDVGYKANRTLDSKKNWKNYNSVVNEFMEILESHGVIIQRMSGAEGDDLIFAWSTYLNSNGENAIIWTGDQDLIQLVNYNKYTNSYTLWHDNTRNKLRVYPGFQNWVKSRVDDSEIDIFNLDDPKLKDDKLKEAFEKIINQDNLNVQEIFCDEFAFVKILTGDKSDNIESVYSYQKTTKTGKTLTYRIKENHALKILAEFKRKKGRYSSLSLFERENIEFICQLIAKHFNTTVSPQMIKNLETNRKLILLHQKTIPEAIQDGMYEMVEESMQLDTHTVHALMNKETILKDTNYVSEEKKGYYGGPKLF